MRCLELEEFSILGYYLSSRVLVCCIADFCDLPISLTGFLHGPCHLFFFLLFLHFHFCGFLFYFVYNLNFPLYESRPNVVQSILFSWLLLKSMVGWWITSVLLIGILHLFSDLDCIFLWELWGADPRSVCSCWAYNFVNVGTGLVI